MAKKTIEDLKEEFKIEPVKNRKVAGSKGKVKVSDWNLDSRNLMINLFFNILGEKYRTAKGKLPSIDAKALGKMDNPIAGDLITYRSNKKTLDSFKNVNSFINEASLYQEEIHRGVIIAADKATVVFNVLGFDNIERIFTVAKKSIPINIDKRARKAFKVPDWGRVSAKDIGEDSLKILNQLKE